MILSETWQEVYIESMAAGDVMAQAAEGSNVLWQYGGDTPPINTTNSFTLKHGMVEYWSAPTTTTSIWVRAVNGSADFRFQAI